MSLKHGLLGMLSLEPMSGYELDKEFKESLKYIWATKSSQIYNELINMEQKGWLSGERIVQDGKPNKRVYSITEKGKTELLDWLSTPDTDVENALTGKSAFLLRVLLAGNTSKEQSLKLLHSFRKVCLSLQAAHGGIREAIARDAPEYDHALTTYWNLVALHGEMMNQTRLAWVEKAISIVADTL